MTAPEAKRKRDLDNSLLENPSKTDDFLNEYLQQEDVEVKKPRLEPIKIKLKTNPPAAVKKVSKVQTDKRLSQIPPGPTKFLGHVVYTGAHPADPSNTDFENLQLWLLPSFGPQEFYATLQVRIPADYLLFKTNLAIRARAVWGTEIYADDSDVFAAIVHSGAYTPMDAPKDKDFPLDDRIPGILFAPFDNTVDAPLPDHDLLVTLRILPRLVRYQGSLKHHLSSRSWGSMHDGESFKIESCVRVPRGSVVKGGRKVGSQAWINHATFLKQEPKLVLGQGKSK